MRSGPITKFAQGSPPLKPDPQLLLCAPQADPSLQAGSFSSDPLSCPFLCPDHSRIITTSSVTSSARYEKDLDSASTRLTLNRVIMAVNEESGALRTSATEEEEEALSLLEL
ncbi:hypothetical protein TREES_T100001826 [Tupaia chinensis]|uniref:Uncharacterized protein n=1 Tax=Tupaia chinensis TaxID=246437 RepID=L9KFF9_TUPCH|nr:hypothetical protein TREES_T100001826 [Tupaia chinensis]